MPIIEESQALEVAKGVAKAGKKVTIKDRGFIVDEVEDCITEKIHVYILSRWKKSLVVCFRMKEPTRFYKKT